MTLYLGKQQVAMTMNHIDESAVAQKVDKVTTPNIVYGTDSNGDQTTYDKNSFGQVDDVQINGTSVVDNKVASITLGTMASETASEYTKTTNLATVATSGSYNDLSDKPTIPSAQVNSDWNATSGVAQILNKPTLGTMASENTTSYYTKTEVDGKLDDKQNIATAVNYDNITNCITEIPQDIKLELVDGTLTLKAGSKVYVPDGFNGTTKKFNEVLISSDVIFSSKDKLSSTEPYLMVVKILSNNSISFDTAPQRVIMWESTSGMPTDNSHNRAYDYTNNLMCYRLGTDNWINESFSLPVCVIRGNTTDGVTSIDQIFNGFGYIGSTVFALPGVKGLIPNGRNEDGSLKNIEFTLDSVKTATRTWLDNYSKQCWGYVKNPPSGTAEIWYWNSFIESETEPSNTGYCMWYKPSENITYMNNQDGATNWQKVSYIDFGKASGIKSQEVKIFTPKTPFHALDYSDKSTISSWGMPSSKYIDLTLGASGATYTAPANGWFAAVGDPTATTGFIAFAQLDTSIGTGTIVVPDTTYKGTRTSICCSKGQRVVFHYGRMNVTVFRFYYAEGEK